MSEHRINLDELAQQSRGHSIFGASSSKMWMGCSGSLIPNIMQKDSGSGAAAEGTVAHAVAEEWLVSGIKPSHLIGTKRTISEGDSSWEITIDEVMLKHLESYVDWIQFEDGDHYVEQQVRYSDLTPILDQGGTADHIICRPGTLIITDLKYGQGIFVEVVNNPQLMLYAYGAMRKFEFDYGQFDEIIMRIAQPRMDNLAEWKITRAELLEFVAKVRIAAHAAWQLDAPRTPSDDACQWCKVKAGCTALAVKVSRITDGYFDNLDSEVDVAEMVNMKALLDSGELNVNPIDAGLLTLEQKAKLFAYKHVITAWLDSIGSELYKRLSDGELVEGYKLVRGRNTRHFANIPAAEAHLEFLGLSVDDYAPRTFISPAECEKVLLKNGYKRKILPECLDSIVASRAGNPTMVPSSDPRPSLANAGEGCFENLDEL